MDLNADGNIDILSGSYSRQGKDMAGLFQVLWGQKGGTWKAAEVLCGSDGEPLIITAGKGDDAVIEKICTRPTAVDLDGDGKLDLVSGNFRGTFAFFQGEGNGKFAPMSTWLLGGKQPLAVQAHSDPFFVDWDRDGDLDLLTGSSSGGVFLHENLGTAKAAKFGKQQTLVATVGHRTGETKMGDGHLEGPQGDTRVWVDDVNGDGKLDLLVGDQVGLVFPAKGVAEAAAVAKLRDWEAKETKVMAAQQTNGGEPSEADMKKFQDAYEALQKERETFVRDERTGFVWVLYQK